MNSILDALLAWSTTVLHVKIVKVKLPLLTLRHTSVTQGPFQELIYNSIPLSYSNMQ